MSVHIIADSGCDIVGNTNPNLTIVPLTITFGDTSYADGVDLTHERFYELLIESDELPVTSQINPFGFTEAIRPYVEAGDDVVVITISGGLSGTYQSAATAVKEFPGHAYAVDSKNACIAERILVEYALRLVDEGLDAASIAAELDAAQERIVLVALLDTLEYLKRGGRIPAAVGTIGDFLAIKPVITVDQEGKVAVLGQARGSKNGRNQLNKLIEKSSGIDVSMPYALGYTGLDDKLLQKYIDDSSNVWEGLVKREDLPIHTVGATIGTHVGPGAIAVAFFEKQ